MQRYPVRNTSRRGLTLENLRATLVAEFGSANLENGWASARYGALDRIAVQPQEKELAVDVTMNPKVPEEVARETIARYNRFLEAATGFSSKERAKRLRKSAGASD